MPRESPYTIRLSHDERAVLEGRARKYTLPYRDVTRAQIVLWRSRGCATTKSRRASTSAGTSKWRKRFFEQRVAGLDERPRRGRPGAFPPRGRG